jgi:hypothetical protein
MGSSCIIRFWIAQANGPREGLVWTQFAPPYEARPLALRQKSRPKQFFDPKGQAQALKYLGAACLHRGG